MMLYFCALLSPRLLLLTQLKYMCSVVYCSYLLTATVIVQIPFVVWISGIRDIVTTTQDTRVTLQYNTEDNELVCKYTERYYVLTDIAKRSNNGLDSSLKDG